ncbi:MAG: Ig-like domain-containing protein [Bryobacteraceae bacterium]
MLLSASSRLLTAQTLKITEPKDGTVVSPGQILHVTVEVSPPGAFIRSVIVIGGDPIGFSDALGAPPYNFSLKIPAQIRPRRYTITADGFVEPGKGIDSDPVDIQVERSDSPLSLTAEPAVLDFREVGDQCPVAAVGKFTDAPRVDLDESSYVQYDSDNPSVATVTEDGHVTAAGFGSAKITVRYNGLSAVVPVTVRNASVGVLPAQTLKITQPKDGTVVYAGQTMTVVVEASPALALHGISIVGEPALGDSPVLNAPPYRFSMRIRPDARPRRYTITAAGLIQPGKEGSSEPVSILVEQSGSPLSLTAEPAVLDLHTVGVQCAVAAVGEFADATRVDLGASRYVKFSSDNPSVATVNGDGLVTAAGVGSARITIEYNGLSTVVPVTVTSPPAGR